MAARPPKGRGALRGLTGDTAADVARMFNNEQIRRLAEIANVPDVNFNDFGEMTRAAVHLYIQERDQSSPHQVRHELERLVNAATSPRRTQEAIVKAFTALSSESPTCPSLSGQA